MDEQALREKARAAIADGRLPNGRLPSGPLRRTWGGPGVGVPCAICGLPVRADQIEFAVEFSHDGTYPGLDKYHVHVRCFAAWEFERDGSGPTCDACLMRVRAEQPVVFSDNGHIEHVECPVVLCVQCLRPLRPGDATRRIGDDVAHRTCPADSLAGEAGETQ